MPQKKKNTRAARTKKSQAQRATKKRLSLKERLTASVVRTKKRIAAFRAARPHRSFVLTRRRDYRRSLAVPGYLTLTIEVGGFIRKNKKVFAGLIVLYSVIVMVMGGLASQSTYISLQDTVSESVTTDYGEIIGKTGQAAMTLLSSLAGSSSIGADQRVYLAVALLLIWMCTVWLAREIMAGHRPRLRDGLYNSGAPFISTLLLGFVVALQLIPIGVLALVYSGLSGVGLINNGFGAMLFGVSALLITSLTLYWLTSTFIALVVVTLPGMYPMRALRLASELVISRRLRVLLRILWAVVMVAGVWLLVFVPLILLESWLRSMWSWLEYVPTIPLLIVLLSSCTVVYLSLYVYIFYRKLVSDESVAGR